MPKTSDTNGATHAGMQGIVQAATGRLDEVDPSLNADGSVKDGFESDERPDLEDRSEDDQERELATANFGDNVRPQDDGSADDERAKDDAEHQPVAPADSDKTGAQDPKVEQGAEKEAKPSVGSNSLTTGASSAKNASKRK